VIQRVLNKLKDRQTHLIERKVVRSASVL